MQNCRGENVSASYISLTRDLCLFGNGAFFFNVASNAMTKTWKQQKISSVIYQQQRCEAPLLRCQSLNKIVRRAITLTSPLCFISPRMSLFLWSQLSKINMTLHLAVCCSGHKRAAEIRGTECHPRRGPDVGEVLSCGRINTHTFLYLCFYSEQNAFLII